MLFRRLQIHFYPHHREAICTQHYGYQINFLGAIRFFGIVNLKIPIDFNVCTSRFIFSTFRKI